VSSSSAATFLASDAGVASKPRQIVAIVLSQLFVELATAQAEVEQLTREKGRGKTGEKAGADRAAEKRTPASDSNPSKRQRSHVRNALAAPRAVVWLREDVQEALELDAKQGLDAVNVDAHRFGVRSGQTIAEARSLVANLAISTVKTATLRAALERVAESMTRFGATVALNLPDTVWVDVTGSTHLFGGEWPLLEEIQAVLDDIGHQARVAMADGPVLAKAFAEWETRRQGRTAVVVSPESKHTCLKTLPLTSLPLSTEVKIAFAKMGLLTAGDLLALEPKAVTSRLGDRASAVMALLHGEDTAPLTAHRPAELPFECLDWDEPVAGNEPVLFALRRLTTQVAARLRGRGLSAQSLELTLRHDPITARFRGKESSSSFVVQLAAPLSRAEDLWRVLAARVQKIQVEVPNVGVALTVLNVEETKQRQLDLAVGFSKLDAADPERMAVLFSELASDIGADNFGTLRLANTHKPEKVTLLCPVGEVSSKTKRGGKSRSSARLDDSRSIEQMNLGEWKVKQEPRENSLELPTRLLASAIPVQTRFRVGELLPLGPRLFTITRVVFQQRLEAVEWWSSEPCSRDYVRLWLSSSQGELQVLAYVDRITQSRYVQGWYD
jgi:protein ImuB